MNQHQSITYTTIGVLSLIGLVALATKLQWYTIIIVLWTIGNAYLGWHKTEDEP